MTTENTSTPAPAPAGDEDFDQLFDEAVAAIAPTTEPAAPAAEPAKPAEPAAPATPAAPAAEPAKPAEPAAPATPAAPAAEPAKPAEPAAPATPAAPAAEPAKPAEPAAPAAEPAKPAEPIDLEKAFPDPVLSEDDQKAYDQFKKDWPDHAPILERREKHLVASLEAKFARTLAAMTQKVYEDFAPFAQAASTSAAKTFREFVLSKHADYDAVKPKLSTWIATQPAYLREPLMRVYNEGNAEEVVDLVQRFKDATGVKPQPPSPPATPPQPPANNRKADDLAPVDSKRPTPAPKGPDLNNFDDAFEEAAEAVAR